MVKRYRHIHGRGIESEKGLWVKYKDYEALESRHRDLVAAVEMLYDTSGTKHSCTPETIGQGPCSVCVAQDAARKALEGIRGGKESENEK